MQQRRLRLGDILDDYCPRERRITNHAVVAMIDDTVKQTRCTTCDADHEYKQAKVPAARRKKDDLVPPVPTDLVPADLAPVDLPDDDQALDELPVSSDSAPLDDEVAPLSAAAAVEAEPEPIEAVDADSGAGAAGEDDGPVHRRLIRATLPRVEGQVPERKAPDFTVRQPGGRGRDFDPNRGNGAGGGGQRHGRARRAVRGPHGQSSGQPPRFGGSSRQGSSQGQGQGQGQRQNGNRPGPPAGQRGGGARPQGQSRGPGRKRGR